MEAGGQHIIRKGGAELFLVESALLVLCSKHKLFQKGDSSIIASGIDVDPARDT